MESVGKIKISFSFKITGVQMIITGRIIWDNALQKENIVRASSCLWAVDYINSSKSSKWNIKITNVLCVS